MDTKKWAAIIAGNVRAAREKSGVTQAVVASRAGIRVPHLSRLESGNHFPSLKTLLLVAHALGVDPCVLLRKKLPKSATGRLT